MASSKGNNMIPILCPYLLQIYGQYSDKKFELIGSEMQIGRHPHSHIRIDCPNVSRKHCTLKCSSEGWTIKDNGSQNGTYINGKRLEKDQRALLQTGDIIFLGPPSEMPQTFCYDSSDREHVIVNANKCDKIEMPSNENNTELKIGSNLSIESSTRIDSGVKVIPENSSAINFHPSTSTGSDNKVPFICKQIETCESVSKKGSQKRTQNRDISGPINKKFSTSNYAPKLPSDNKLPKPCKKGSKNGDVKAANDEIEDSQSLLFDVNVDVEFDHDPYPFSQALDESVCEISSNESFREKVKGGVPHEVKNSLHMKEADSELLKSKLAVLSAEIKNLEQSKSDLLKEYVDVCEKNKLLDQQLAEQKKLKEDIQMCETRVRNNIKEQIMDKLEEELICNICTEVLIKPTVLDCSHTFCEHCIAEWIKKKKQCPICRNKVQSQTRVLALDHFIDKTLETFTPGQKERRKNLILEREQRKVEASSSRHSSGRGRRRSARYSFRGRPRLPPVLPIVPQPSHPSPTIPSHDVEIVAEVMGQPIRLPPMFANVDWSPQVLDVSDMDDSSLDEDMNMFACFNCGRFDHLHFECPGV